MGARGLRGHKGQAKFKSARPASRDGRYNFKSESRFNDRLRDVFLLLLG